MLIIFAVIFWHALHGDLGLRSFGSAAYGSRNSIDILLAMAAYLLAANIPSLPLSLLRKLPFYTVAITIITNVPYFITTFWPSLTPYFYYFTDAVNMGSYQDTLGYGVDIVRQGSLASIGLVVQGYLVSRYPIGSWVRPGRWIILFLSLACLGCTLIGGYRSILFLFILVTVIGAWCYYFWKTLFAVPILAMVLGGLMLLHQSAVIEFPITVQRTLAFLPGKWDLAVNASVESSNDFRRDMQKTYLRDSFHQNFWKGSGFSYDSEKADYLRRMAYAYGRVGQVDYTIEWFLASKQFHVGWISAHDAVGLIGGLAFVAFGIALLYQAYRLVVAHRSGARNDAAFPLKVWLLCNLCMLLGGYFIVFGDFSNALVHLCAYAIVLCLLIRGSSETSSAPEPSPSAGRYVADGPGKPLPDALH